MAEPIFAHGGPELLDAISFLWEQQRRHHADVSPAFGPALEQITFAQRRLGLERKGSQGALRIDTVRLARKTALVGYCISTIDADSSGEVESLFIEEPYRSQGLGEALMKRTLGWLDEADVRRITVAVIVGNERALSFYERFGLVPRTMILERPPG
ncbi:MAG: GNAT family N-acetyltransferase [Candidatus Latescibacteria bacterium]|jgi:GNAT superfamily N-acetyltransferase|nr:GNAT family N-acetyltransferase [Gemmatimonadaceae bacterium]MDP6015811.1 GNAT family N-acetyltransferase [Candidatus Latescibacterota bacterium]